jgi:galactokinase
MNHFPFFIDFPCVCSYDTSLVAAVSAPDFYWRRNGFWSRRVDQQTKQEFVRRFGNTDGAFILTRAPGRVNLIGEHTDYNDGFVFPIAIDRYTTILAKARTDTQVRIFSTTQNELTEFSIAGPVAKDSPQWSLYAKGVAEALRQRGLVKNGIDAMVSSTVPIGGGLSSSASFEVATGLAFLTANGKTLDKIELALAAQWAEHNYASMPCGIMDQFISALGEKDHAMLLDCRDLSQRQISMEDADMRIFIANSNVKHKLVEGEYQARRNQCERAVAILRKKFPAVKALRDADLSMLKTCRMDMDPTVFRRARHVISENTRTLQFAEAMASGNWSACGKLMYASHESLRDDYGVSCPELDFLVEIAATVQGVYGARMTGGGFGGSMVAMIQSHAIKELTAVIAQKYPQRFALEATMFSTTAGDGAQVVSS